MTDSDTSLPTPYFDRPGTSYRCPGCGEYIIPQNGDPEAALLIAGATEKLCIDCARNILDTIQAGGSDD
jgi:hypothetical protein